MLLGARIDKSRVWPALIGGSLPLLAEQTHLLQKLAPVTWPSQMCKCYDQPRNAASRSLYHKTCVQVHAASKGSKAPGIVCRAAVLLYQLTHLCHAAQLARNTGGSAIFNLPRMRHITAFRFLNSRLGESASDMEESLGPGHGLLKLYTLNSQKIATSLWRVKKSVF